MNIMAIDASTKSSGIAIFQDTELIYCNCITSSSNDLIKRIKTITKGIEQILSNYQIDKIILEEVRPESAGNNLKTHKALMWLQASIAFMVYDNPQKIEIEYIYPSSWRASCGIHTGRGIKRDELKAADIAFVKKKFNLDVNDDIADAIGIGFSYTNKLEW